MDLVTFEQLLSPMGQLLLEEVLERTPHEADLALGTRLRKTYAPNLVAAAVTQNHLRGKARAKFGEDAPRMYFTHDALEQSTRMRVAVHRANRLVSSGAEEVADLGCGIGGDLIAFARSGLRARGIELDPVRAAIAAANLRALGLDGSVACEDVHSVTIGRDEVAFIDPARRDGRGRNFSTADLRPRWDWIRERLDGRAVAKLMPGLAHDAVPAGIEAEWVSDAGDLVEACLWGAPFATATRRATVLPSGLALVSRGEQVALAEPGAFIYEPDDAVIRSGLVGEFAAMIGGWLLDSRIAYVSADRSVATPLARGFRVVDELPFREKPLKVALQVRRVGTLTVKKRGVDIVPDELIRRLKLKGPKIATVIMTRVRGEGRAFLVERL